MLPLHGLLVLIPTHGSAKLIWWGLALRLNGDQRVVAGPPGTVSGDSLSCGSAAFGEAFSVGSLNTGPVTGCLGGAPEVKLEPRPASHTQFAQCPSQM
jgi:hypothetical protein